MKNLCTLLTFILWTSSIAVAQNTVKPVQKNTPATSEMEKDTVPSLSYQKYWAILDSLHNDTLPMRPMILKGDYYRLLVPLTYYYSPLARGNDLNWRSEELTQFEEVARELLPVDTLLFTQVTRTQRQIDALLLKVYKENPDLIVNTEADIMRHELVKVDIPAKEPSKNPIMRLFAPDNPEEKKVESVEVSISKPNFWVTGGSGSLQWSQNEISDNWHKGGESATNLLGNFKMFANYNDKNKVQFENLLEARAGFNSVSSDTVRKYRVNTDLFRLYSKLGVRAASHWYYTLSGEFNTQFFNNYKANSKDVVSSFMSPANLIFSIGMDYKVVKEKINLSVFLSPLTYNLRYVGNDKVNETAFGLEEGKKTLQDFGSKMQTNLSWKIIPSIVYDARLYYFTNYEKVEAEWESTVNFVLNRYLSAKLFVHVRFDDGAARFEDKSFFQVYESLSFGLNYTW